MMVHENVTSGVVIQLLLLPFCARQHQALPGVGQVGVHKAEWRWLGPLSSCHLASWGGGGAKVRSLWDSEARCWYEPSCQGIWGFKIVKHSWSTFCVQMLWRTVPYMISLSSHCHFEVVCVLQAMVTLWKSSRDGIIVCICEIFSCVTSQALQCLWVVSKLPD